LLSITFQVNSTRRARANLGVLCHVRFGCKIFVFELEISVIMFVSDPNNVKIYNLSAGKSLPEVYFLLFSTRCITKGSTVRSTLMLD
jgi:hypothetical protein